MRRGDTLAAVLEGAAEGAAPVVGAAVRAISALAGAAADLSAIIAAPALEGSLGAKTGGDNSDGDQQRRLDLVAEDLCREALLQAGVGPYLSEEVPEPLVLDPAGAVAVAIDPLDGSSNIEVNGVIGTIFSVLPAPPAGQGDPALAFAVPGLRQIAAGFFVYGPQTSLVVSVGAGTSLFTLDRGAGAFRLVEGRLEIPEHGSDFAINASNARHWTAPVRRYIDDCLSGREGVRGRDFNMRWAASLVADALRVFTRGGVFLYPADARPGYQQGRLRLLYEASPIAFLAKQAGGAAIDGETDVLDLVPERPHARVPLIMGSAAEVEAVRRHHLAGAPSRREATPAEAHG